MNHGRTEDESRMKGLSVLPMNRLNQIDSAIFILKWVMLRDLSFTRKLLAIKRELKDKPCVKR